MITFYKRQEMAVYETELLCASTEMVLFCDSFHDAMREWRTPVGWTWGTNDSRFVIYSGRKHQPQSPNPLVCDAGIEQRSAWGEVFIKPVYFTMKALCKVPGRIDITMHYTPEGRPILDYLVNELALFAAGFPGKTSAPPASAEIPQIDAGNTAIETQSDDQAGAPAIDEETERRLTAVRGWPAAKRGGVKRRDYVHPLAISESGLTRWRDKLRNRGFDVPDF